jgi:hypothetical protein
MPSKRSERAPGYLVVRARVDREKEILPGIDGFNPGVGFCQQVQRLDTNVEDPSAALNAAGMLHSMAAVNPDRRYIKSSYKSAMLQV